MAARFSPLGAGTRPQDAYSQLSRVIEETQGSAAFAIRTERFVEARGGQIIRVRPGVLGMDVVLEKATGENFGQQVQILAQTSLGALRVVSVGGKVNGASAYVLPTGLTVLVTLTSNGESGWVTAPDATATGGATADAEYVLGAADASLPNARVATDSTEIDAELTVANVISWALRVGSVGLNKLANLTGLSVLGRAANSAGVMAAITATTARQVLRANAGLTSLEWGFPVTLQDQSVSAGDVHTINFVDGTHTTAAVTAPVSGVSSVAASVNTVSLATAMDSVSVPANAGTFERGALTGAIEAAQGTNATTFGPYGTTQSVLVNATSGAAVPTLLNFAANEIMLRAGGNLTSFTLGSDSFLARIGGDIVSYPFSTFVGTGLNYAAGVLSVAAAAPTIPVNTTAGAQANIALASTDVGMRFNAVTTVSGFTGGADGRTLDLFCGTAGDLTLEHAGAGSLAANQIACPDGINYRPATIRGGVRLMYQNGAWRVIGPIGRNADYTWTGAHAFNGATLTANTTGGIDLTAGGDVRLNSGSVGIIRLDTALGIGNDIEIASGGAVDISGSQVNVSGEILGTSSAFRVEMARTTSALIGTLTEDGAFFVLNDGISTPDRPAFKDLVGGSWALGYAAENVLTASTAVINAVSTEITLASFSLQANTAKIGTCYVLRGWVEMVHSAAALPVLDARLYVAGVNSRTWIGLANAFPATAQTYCVCLEVVFTIRTLGAGGTCVVSGTVGGMSVGATPTTVAINTTIANTIELRGLMNTAVASNTLQGHQGYAQRIR